MYMLHKFLFSVCLILLSAFFLLRFCFILLLVLVSWPETVGKKELGKFFRKPEKKLTHSGDWGLSNTYYFYQWSIMMVRLRNDPFRSLKLRWLKWISGAELSCGHYIWMKLKRKYRATIGVAIPYGLHVLQLRIMSKNEHSSTKLSEID